MSSILRSARDRPGRFRYLGEFFAGAGLQGVLAGVESTSDSSRSTPGAITGLQDDIELLISLFAVPVFSAFGLLGCETGAVRFVLHGSFSRAAFSAGDLGFKLVRSAST